jgi:hypothetical protein
MPINVGGGADVEAGSDFVEVNVRGIGCLCGRFFWSGAIFVSLCLDGIVEEVVEGAGVEVEMGFDTVDIFEVRSS